VKNLAYLCVKLQSEIGGDEQIKKHNRIGGLNNTTQIPLKTAINAMIDQFKKEIASLSIELPSQAVMMKYEQQYSQTRKMLNDILAKYYNLKKQQIKKFSQML
jgi:predicted component of viral defense system (DUF524 family)